jgi:hypothetical protein
MEAQKVWEVRGLVLWRPLPPPGKCSLLSLSLSSACVLAALFTSMPCAGVCVCGGSCAVVRVRCRVVFVGRLGGGG